MVRAGRLYRQGLGFESLHFYKLKLTAMTETQIKRLNKGARIRVIESVKCHPMYKKGGTLIFQPYMDCTNNEYTYGIECQIGNTYNRCFEFIADELEIIPKKKNRYKKYFISL